MSKAQRQARSKTCIDEQDQDFCRALKERAEQLQADARNRKDKILKNMTPLNRKKNDSSYNQDSILNKSIYNSLKENKFNSSIKCQEPSELQQSRQSFHRQLFLNKQLQKEIVALREVSLKGEKELAEENKRLKEEAEKNADEIQKLKQILRKSDYRQTEQPKKTHAKSVLNITQFARLKEEADRLSRLLKSTSQFKTFITQKQHKDLTYLHKLQKKKHCCCKDPKEQSMLWSPKQVIIQIMRFKQKIGFSASSKDIQELAYNINSIYNKIQQHQILKVKKKHARELSQAKRQLEASLCYEQIQIKQKKQRQSRKRR